MRYIDESSRQPPIYRPTQYNHKQKRLINKLHVPRVLLSLLCTWHTNRTTYNTASSRNDNSCEPMDCITIFFNFWQCSLSILHTIICEKCVSNCSRASVEQRPHCNRWFLFSMVGLKVNCQCGQFPFTNAINFVLAYISSISG